MCVSRCKKCITNFNFIVSILLCFFSSAHAVDSANLSLHGLFSDHAVLQRGVEVPVWGTANAGAIVNVSFSGQNQVTIADSEGQWMVKLDPLVASANGETMTVTSEGQTETRVDILVGEVWLASGQSNMAMGMFVADPFNPPSSIPSVQQSSSNTPLVRLLQMNVGRTSVEQSNDLTGNEKWRLSDRAGIYNFSSVGFYFGRSLNQALNVPVGIISGTAGGTSIRRWMPDSFIQSDDSCSELSSGINYNYAIAPLLPYALKGVIWYQGESNANLQKVHCYYDDLTTLIESWRSEWAIAANISKYDFPFYFVQLPNFKANVHANSWIKIREHMLRVNLDTENTEMVVTIDVGDPNDVHPRLKLPVGERLAKIARALDYGESIVYSGPVFKSIALSGNTAILSFNHIGSGLVSTNGQSLKYFEIAGLDGIYYDSQAFISNNKVFVRSNMVSSPVKVRYAWRTNPENPNFANQEGLVASPFRTDAEFWGDESNIGGISNIAAVANDDVVGPVEAGGIIDFNVKDNDVDSDGNLASASIVIVSVPQHGNATINSSGGITYTSTGTTPTTDTLSYLIVDADGAISNEATVSITVTASAHINQIPIAHGDTATVQSGESLTIDVIANDSDSDGTLDKNSLLIVSDPSYGTVDIDFATGEITYNHDGGTATIDSFTYTVEDDRGTLSNEATVSISIIASNSVESCGKALDLDGIDDWVNIPNLFLTNDFTIEGWFNLAPGIDYRDAIFGQEGSGPDIHFSAGRVRLYAYGIRVTAKTPLIADTWGHIAITRSDSSLTVYVNGVKDATGRWNGPLSIKALGRGNRGFAKGMMDEIRIWELARTETEIGNSYDTSVDPNTAGLIGYWNFNDADQIITDASSLGNHGTLGTSTADGADDPIRLDSTTPLIEDCDGAVVEPPAPTTAPIANNDTVGSIEVGGTISFSVTENDIDTDGDLNPTSVLIVSTPSDGNATVNDDGTITYVNTGATAIIDTLSYTVADLEGLISNEATVSITVTEPELEPVAPIANNDTVGPVEAGEVISFTVTDNDVSNNGNLNLASVVVVSNPTDGTATVDATGTITYQNTGTTAITDTLSYTVTDSEGAISNVAIVTITVTQPPIIDTVPIADNDSIGPVETGGTITFTVTDNDTDSDGDLNPASVVIVSEPTDGTATVGTSGTITYINTGTSAITDTLTYTVANTEGQISNEATVTITVTEPSDGTTTESCGKGMEFDGINDWINIPDFRLARDFTIEGWFKLAPGIDYRDPLFGQEGSGPDIHFSAGRVRLYAYGIRVTAKTPLIADTWGHIAITRSGSDLTVYINGVKDATGRWKGILNIKAIGRGNRGFVKGMMDEIRIWELARTEAEIGSSYDTSVAPNTVGLIGYWSFNDADQIVADYSSMDNHGTLGASTTESADDPLRLDSTAPLTESCD